jgi:hypothetical protein
MQPCELSVCTTAIPRLLVERCVGSFLDCMADRAEFRLHWKVHLDQYPGLEEYRAETRQQIQRLCSRFDTAVVLCPEKQALFGGAAKALFAESMSDTLWIEDDWLWTRPFRLADVRARLAETGATQFSFVGVKAAVGNMHPTYWTAEQVQYIAKHFPEPLEEVCEGTISKVCGRGGFGLCSSPAINGCCRHIGNEQLIAMGHTHNHVGQPLAGHYHRPRRRDGQWVKR